MLRTFQKVRETWRTFFWLFSGWQLQVDCWRNHYTPEFSELSLGVSDGSVVELELLELAAAAASDDDEADSVVDLTILFVSSCIADSYLRMSSIDIPAITLSCKYDPLSSRD